MSNPMTKYKLSNYREALAMWGKAVDELDQAVAALKDIDLHCLQTGTNPYHATAQGLYLRCIQMHKALEDASCDECGEPISAHADGKCGAWIE